MKTERRARAPAAVASSSGAGTRSSIRPPCTWPRSRTSRLERRSRPQRGLRLLVPTPSTRPATSRGASTSPGRAAAPARRLVEPSTVDAGDADARADREGFTQSGNRAARSGPTSRALNRGDSTWGRRLRRTVASKSACPCRPRGEDVGADVGTSSHRQALDAAVLAKGAVQGREATSAPSSPPAGSARPCCPRGSSRRCGRRHSIPRSGGAQPGGHRDPERSETSCSDERPR